MGKSCCEAKSSELDLLRKKQGAVLKWVLAINATMFFVEFYFGLVSKSTALTADSLDMLGDATVYAFSLYVLNKSNIWRVRAGLLKGILMVLLGVLVLSQTVYKMFSGVIPVAETMTIIGGVALLANLMCVYLLYRHRSDDINMSSTWLCSRNDIVANISVIGASYLVIYTNSAWPDWIVGSAIAYLFLSSAFGVIQEALKQHKEQLMEVRAVKV